MKRHPLSVLSWLILFVLVVGLACGIPSGSEEPVDKPVEASPTPVDTDVTDQPESPVESAPAAVSNLQDVQGAVIQIEAQGTFVDPEWGQYSGAGRGSGFIIDPSGIAVTNNHVVTGAALLKVWVGGDTSQTYNARVLGVSECSDLAVIDIDGDGFPFLEWYDSPIQVGLEVYTAGFPLGEPEYTLTKGIISKESTNGETNWASVDSVLMHDATINPGNSGGPLIDAKGKVVGVNYAAYKEADQYFAIGKDVAVPLVKTLQGGQNVDSVGINGTAVVSDDGSQSGIWVSSVASGSPADKVGITGGDILMTVEGYPIAADGTMSDYCDILRTHTENDIISIEVLRFMTQEYLEGQLNGPALSVVESFDVPTEEVVEGDTPAFYIEEFDPDSSNVQYWSWFLTNGDENGFDIYTEGGKLVFDITGKHIYSYFAYDPYFYEDVRLDAIAENRGMNNNNVSLICRATDEGWYEFSIANNGLWWIYGYDGDYSMLANGGSTAVNMGKGVNEYTILCYGNTLALYINGSEIHTMYENNFAFREGQVGIGVSSFDVLPIIVEFDWVAISDTME
jgi:S1-C subfamily serine protease